MADWDGGEVGDGAAGERAWEAGQGSLHCGCGCCSMVQVEKIVRVGRIDGECAALLVVEEW